MASKKAKTAAKKHQAPSVATLGMSIIPDGTNDRYLFLIKTNEKNNDFY